MINKRRAIPLIVVIFIVCIVLALGLYHVFTSFDIKRSEDIVGAINVTTTGSSENIPLATSNNGDFSGIFFQEAEYNKLIILKKNWMTGRYSCWGTASTLSTVGTYQSVDSHNRIVVVYSLSALLYTFHGTAGGFYCLLRFSLDRLGRRILCPHFRSCILGIFHCAATGIFCF